MSKQLLAGIDVGTTGVKTILFEADGTVFASAYQEYGCIYPQPRWVEQDPEMLLDAIYATCRQAMSAVEGAQVAAISVSAQRSSAILLDDSGHALKMISWLDNRAVEQSDEIAAQFGAERFYQITGLPLCATRILPKLLHTRKNSPELWRRTRRVCQLHDFVLHALGADDFYGNEAEAGFWGLWDNRNLCYSDDLLRAFSIDRTMLLEIRRTGEQVGTISADVSEKTGFPLGTPLCIGVGDLNSAALGAGVVEPGAVSISLGTGGLATIVLDGCYRDPMCQSMVTSHAIHGLWTFEGLQNAAAGAYRWFRDEIAALEKVQAENPGAAYETLNHMIEQIPVGAHGLIMMPYFAGSAAPRWNALARGGFVGLTLAHTRSDMARACVEGITLEQKDILQSMKNAGKTFSYVRIVGGATKSEVWNQIQADVYGLPCETLAVSDAAALGAAISAGYGVGVFASLKEGAERMVQVKKRYEPNSENTRKYEKLYDIYCKLYEALAKTTVYQKMAEFSLPTQGEEQ